MRKPWSISTTVRNAERVRDFLVILRSLEGHEWSVENQKRYQILLIKNRVYGKTTQFLNNLNKSQVRLLQSSEEITYEQAENIFLAKKYREPAMRGRQSANPLKKLGLVKIEQSKIYITPLGNYLLREDYDLGEMFFRSFLKWQLPNPDSRSFSSKDGFKIKPFIATLHFIQKVNDKWRDLGKNPVGISKEEFAIFVPTLIDFAHIDDQVVKLINFRVKCENKTHEEKKRIIDNFKKDFVKTYLRSNNVTKINQCIRNLNDYGDNIIRYFRLTRFFYIRGEGFYIDLEPRRHIEIRKIIESDIAKPLEFSTKKEYQEYIADIAKPVLPWENGPILKNIIEELITDIVQLSNRIKVREIAAPVFELKKFDRFSKIELKEYLEYLRRFRRELQDAELYRDSQSLENLRVCISSLENIYASKSKKSIELERLVNIALNALNDALRIKPNYPVGDDNQPTFTAPANKPDIECFYDSFCAICEVTMRKDRSQWFEEGQPVMRHLRDFENKNKEKHNFCLFIAPSVHRDTLNTFWFAIKYEYEGSKQKIIPVTLAQFIKFLNIFSEIKQLGLNLKHTEILKLYEDIIKASETTNSSEEWVQKISEKIENWKNSLII